MRKEKKKISPKLGSDKLLVDTEKKECSKKDLLSLNKKVNELQLIIKNLELEVYNLYNY